MASFSSEQIRKKLEGIGVRQVRLVCGVILFAYLVSHFLNHALGNISMNALAEGVYYHTLFWQFPPVGMALYGAMLVHFLLGVWAMYRRRQCSWKTVEPLQLVLGLSIPALVAAHIVGVHVAQTMFGHQKLYPQELYAFWVAYYPVKTLEMSAVLVIAWVHGCIGLHFWLRMKPFYKRLAPYLLAGAVLVPTLALLGFYQGGQMVIADADDPDWRIRNLTKQQVGTAAEQSTLDSITDGFLTGYLVLLGLVVLARGVRVLNERRGGMIALSYGNGRPRAGPTGRFAPPCRPTAAARGPVVLPAVPAEHDERKHPRLESRAHRPGALP